MKNVRVTLRLSIHLDYRQKFGCVGNFTPTTMKKFDAHNVKCVGIFSKLVTFEISEFKNILSKGGYTCNIANIVNDQ